MKLYANLHFGQGMPQPVQDDWKVASDFVAGVCLDLNEMCYSNGVVDHGDVGTDCGGFEVDAYERN